MFYDLRIVAIAAAAALASYALARIAGRNWMPGLAKFAFVLMLVAALFMAASGVAIAWSGQQDVLMAYPRIAELVRSGEGSRSALVLGLARNWAYGVIFIGGSLALEAGKGLLRSLRH